MGDTFKTRRTHSKGGNALFVVAATPVVGTLLLHVLYRTINPRETYKGNLGTQ